MKLMMRNLKWFFGSNHPSSGELLTGDSSKLVAHFSSGNVSLQRGLYLTAKELDSRRERVTQYQFTNNGSKDAECG